MNHKKRVSTKQKQYKLYIYLDFLASKLRSNDFIILPRYKVISKLSSSPPRLRYFPRLWGRSPNPFGDASLLTITRVGCKLDKSW